MTRKEQNKILDDKIVSNVNQYKGDRLNVEISAFSSGDLNKYEFLKRIDLNYKPNALDKARFEFSPLGRAFNEGLGKTIPNYQEEGVIKLLKEIRDNLAGGINRPAGLIIPPGPPGAQGPLPPGPPQTPLSSLSSSSDSSSDLTSVTPITPPPAPRTTINTRILPTPSVSLPTPSRIPRPSQIPTPTPISTSIATPGPTLSRISTPTLISTSISTPTPISTSISTPTPTSTSISTPS